MMKDSNDNDGDNCDDDNNNDYKRPQKPLKNDSFATRGFPTLLYVYCQLVSRNLQSVMDMMPPFNIIRYIPINLQVHIQDQ